MSIPQRLWNGLLDSVKQAFTTYLLLVMLITGTLLAIGQWLAVPEGLAESWYPTPVGGNPNPHSQQLILGWSWLTKTIWSAGIFTAILKGMTYMGLFRQEILEVVRDPMYLDSISKELKAVVVPENAQLHSNLKNEVLDLIYSRRFIEDWGNIHTVWSNLTSHLLPHLLPDIVPPIKKSILDSYFSPATTDYYMQNYRIEMKLELLDEENLKIHETLRFVVVVRDPNVTTRVKYVTDGEAADGNGAVVGVDFRVLNVNQVCHKDKITVNNGELNGFKRRMFAYDIELTGKDRYEVERHITRVVPFCDPKDGPTRGIRFARFVHGLEVKVEHPPELVVFLRSEGTINQLENGPFSASNILDKRYNGLLLPWQGFRVTWVRKNVNV